VIAIVDDSSRRYNRHYLDAVFIGTGFIVLIGDNLQIIKITEKDNYHQYGYTNAYENSGTEYS
jgi:hypothetical protein